MKTPRFHHSLTFLLFPLSCLPTLAQTTIDPTGKYAWAANAGWINFEAGPAAGAEIGEYVAAGYIYSANLGWIQLGDGTPANGIQYGNASASDFGVNVTGYGCPAPGVHTAALRGFAYGANIGWINFETTGDPRVDLGSGKLRGYAWSANVGWLNLGELSANVNVVTTLRPGADSDSDGIADAFEFTHAGLGNLATLGTPGDADGDGSPDAAEYLADTDPLDPAERFRVTAIVPTGPAGAFDITFTSSLRRVYRLETNSNLLPPWTTAAGPLKPAGPTTTVLATDPDGPPRQFWRVTADLPLRP